MKAVEFNNVTFSYPDAEPVFRSLSFAIEAGESLGIVGANGSGKTTLLHLLFGILEPASGSITVGGLLSGRKNRKSIRSYAGLVFQNPAEQLFCPTVLEDVSFGPRCAGADAEEAERAALAVLGSLGMTGHAYKPPYQLSGGEARLASVACVLAAQPQLLCLDEPSSNLDPRSRRGLISVLQGLGMTKIIVSHDLDLILALCPRTMILHGGVCAASGDSRELLSDGLLLSSLGL